MLKPWNLPKSSILILGFWHPPFRWIRFVCKSTTDNKAEQVLVLRACSSVHSSLFHPIDRMKLFCYDVVEWSKNRDTGYDSLNVQTDWRRAFESTENECWMGRVCVRWSSGVNSSKCTIQAHLEMIMSENYWSLTVFMSNRNMLGTHSSYRPIMS